MMLGIQSSPIFSPPGTRGADTGVPWDDGTCAVGSQFLRLEGGKVSRSDSYTLKGLENGHTMFERILRNPGKRCTKTHSEFIVGSLKAKADVQLSFREAMARCAASDQCFGVSFNISAASTTEEVLYARADEQSGGIKLPVRFCSSRDRNTISTTDWLTLHKKFEDSGTVSLPTSKQCQFEVGKATSSFFAFGPQREAMKAMRATALTADECAFMVKQKYPIVANGVTFNPMTGGCFAAFGMDGIDDSSTDEYVSCKLFTADSNYGPYQATNVDAAWRGDIAGIPLDALPAEARPTILRGDSLPDLPEHVLARELGIRNPSWPGYRPSGSKMIKISFQPVGSPTCSQLWSTFEGARCSWCARADCAARVGLHRLKLHYQLWNKAKF